MDFMVVIMVVDALAALVLGVLDWLTGAIFVPVVSVLFSLGILFLVFGENYMMRRGRTLPGAEASHAPRPLPGVEGS